MKDRIIKNAKIDTKLYLKDFNSFWSSSFDHINDDELYEIYSTTLIFKNYKLVFETLKFSEYSIIINEIFEDLNSSFFLSMMGLYRSAYMHLRSSIELTLQLIYFIHHPIEFLQWKNNRFMIKHDKLTKYIEDHPHFDTDISTLMGKITGNWKKFSKHIHGESPIFFQCEKDSRKTSSFTVQDYNSWKTNFLKSSYDLNKLLLLFFKSELNSFPRKNKELLIGMLIQSDRDLLTN